MNVRPRPRGLTVQELLDLLGYCDRDSIVHVVGNVSLPPNVSAGDYVEVEAEIRGLYGIQGAYDVTLELINTRL